MSTVAGRRLEPPQTVVERALAASTSDGCAVVVEEVSEAEVRFANNTTTTNGVRHDRRVVVVTFRSEGGAGGARVGSGRTPVGVASASGMVDVEQLVRASEAEVRRAPPAGDAAPLIEDDASSSVGKDFDQAPEFTSPSVLDGVVGGLSGAFGRARASGRLLAGFATHGVSTTYLGTSTGLRRRYVQPAGTMELVGRSTDGKRSVWSGAGTSSFEDIDMAAFEQRVTERLGWAERTVELPAGRYEVLLPPDAAADLMVAMSQGLSGRDAEEGRSAFSAPGGGTKVGESLSSLAFDLRGDPKEPGLECVPFVVTGASGTDVSVFDNGLPVGLTHWISGGRLERLRYHRAAAARSGVEPAPPVDNLTLEVPGATATLADMVARTERALLLTCLWYIREVDPVTMLLTGLTRDGVYLVEKGEVVGAVNNFRFNESPLEVLARSTEASRSVRALSREWGEWQNRTAMPALRVAEFNMSSVSPAT